MTASSSTMATHCWQQQRQPHSFLTTNHSSPPVVGSHFTTSTRGIGQSCDEDSSSVSSGSSSSSPTSPCSSYKNSFKKPTLPDHSLYVALDCEMVGGISGESLCARVVLVDWKGRTLLDRHVKPNQVIADYRTAVSGILPTQLEHAAPLEEVRAQVLRLIHDKIVIGHGLDHDFRCLGIAHHPWHCIRDTATYRPFCQLDGYGRQVLPRKLKDLVKEKLNKTIQDPSRSHSPREDAKAALSLYKCHRPRWEACVVYDMKKLAEKQLQQSRKRHYYSPHYGGNHYYYQQSGQRSCAAAPAWPRLHEEIAAERNCVAAADPHASFAPLCATPAAPHSYAAALLQQRCSVAGEAVLGY